METWDQGPVLSQPLIKEESVGKSPLRNDAGHRLSLNHLREGRESMPVGLEGKPPTGTIPGVLGTVAVPAKHPLPEIPKPKTMPLHVHPKMKQKGKFLGETTL